MSELNGYGWFKRATDIYAARYRDIVNETYHEHCEHTRMMPIGAVISLSTNTAV